MNLEDTLGSQWYRKQKLFTEHLMESTSYHIIYYGIKTDKMSALFVLQMLELGIGER